MNYLFTVHAAKHVAMLERTDRGRAVRQHFIDIEETWQAERVQAPRAALTDEQIVALVVTVVERMLPKLVDAALRSDNRIAAVDSVGAREVCDELGVACKGRSGLIRSVSNRLQKFSAMHAHIVRTSHAPPRCLSPRPWRGGRLSRVGRRR